MPFVIKPSRKYTFTYEEEGNKLEADFDFICMEDGISEEVRNKLKDHNPDNPNKEAILSILWYNIRRSLKTVRGIQDEEGKNIEITDDNIQKAVFEFIIKCGDLRLQILTAYIGTAEKNLKPGVTLQ